MRLTYFTALLVVAVPMAAAGCGGAGDPLGGPYGGTEGTIAPNSGNLSSVAAEDAGDIDAETPSSSGGGSGSEAGSSSGSSSGGGSGSSSGGKASSGSSSASVHDAGTGSSSGTASGSSSGATSGSSSGAASSSSSGAASSSSSGAASSSSSGGTTTAPTFTTIFSEYLKSGTVGNCTRCHGEMGSASGAYSWLSGQGYISGTGSALVGNRSCLTWYGGNMPPGGPWSDAQAASEMNAWVAAGAKNN
jgi:hypothetical protein